MHTPSPENSFQIFNQQQNFQVPKAAFPNVQPASVPPSPFHSSRETYYHMYSPTHYFKARNFRGVKISRFCEIWNPRNENAAINTILAQPQN